MSLEKNLARRGMVVGGLVSAVISLDYCLGKFDLTEMDNLLWQARVKATIYTPLISTLFGALTGKYIGKGLGTAIDYFNQKI